MIDFSGYTAKAIEKAMLDQVPDHIDTREGSIVQTAIGPAAWYLEGLYMILGQLQDNAYADTAVGKALDLIVQQRGLVRTPAVSAVRKGTFNVPVPSGAQFKTINGGDSVIFTVGISRSDGGEGYGYEMICRTPGIIGNSYIGNLIPVTAISGLTSAVLGDIITAGVEEETDQALRARFFETFRVAAFGGNIQSYRNEILAIPGIGAVQVYPVWQGGGTVLCSVLDDKFKPALPSVVQSIQTRICPPEDDGTSPSANGYGIAPIGASVTITTATALTLDIACDIQFVSGISNGEQLYQKEIENKIEEYLDSVRKSWGNPLKSHVIDYPVAVYVSRIMYAILSIPEIANVTNVLINGLSEDLHLTETADLQQVPVLGEVVIHSE